MEKKMQTTIMGYMGGWQEYYNRDPKRDHNFDNHPRENAKNLYLHGCGKFPPMIGN